MRILSTDPLPELALELLAPLGTVAVRRQPGDVVDADVLIVRASPLDADTIAAAPRLRVIARSGAGVDGVDVAAATERGIPVLFAPGAGSIPMAEGAFALILAAAKRLCELGALVTAGQWERRYEIVTADLYGSVLGVVGYGSIGREVARLGRAFGMDVVAHDPLMPANGADDEAVAMVALPELLARADVVSLHCVLTEETRGMIDRSLLAQAKRGAILVNVARGPIVESEDLLLEALQEGWLDAVGLDVFGDEPPDPRHPLFAHPRVVVTAHAVGLTRRWNENVFGALARDIGAVLRGEMPENVVNPQVLAAAAPAAQGS